MAGIAPNGIGVVDEILCADTVTEQSTPQVLANFLVLEIHAAVADSQEGYKALVGDEIVDPFEPVRADGDIRW